MSGKLADERRKELEEVALLARDGLITEDEARRRREVILRIGGEDAPPPAYISPSQTESMMAYPPATVPLMETALYPAPVLMAGGVPPHHYFAMVQGAIDRVDPSYKKKFMSLVSLEAHIRNLAIALSVLFFPIGLLALAGVIPRVRSPLSIGMNVIILVFSLGGFLPLVIVGAIPYCYYYYSPGGYQPSCYSRWYVGLFSIIFAPALLLSLTSLAVAIKANLLEKWLLATDAISYHIMRQDPLAVTGQLDLFEVSYRRLELARKHTFSLLISASVFFAPLAFLLFFANQPRHLRIGLAASFAMIFVAVLAIGLTGVFYFGFYILLGFVVVAFLLSLPLFIMTWPYERLLESLRAQDPQRLTSRSFQMTLTNFMNVWDL